jgi:Cu/Ag efflux protein CusF
MKRSALALLLALAAPAGAQHLKDGAMAVEQNEAVVTVMAVDVAKKTVTIRGPKGNVETLEVPQESQNLDKVKPGDRFKLKYIEAVAVGISKGGAPEQSETKDVKVSPKGGTPGGMIVRTQKRSVMIDAVDYKSRYIAVRGANAQTLALKVADDVPIEQLSAGDRVSIVYTQAVVAEMVPQPKKPAAKKAAPKK